MEKKNITIVNNTKIVLGERYVIKPENPRKLKNRDRVCTIVDYDKENLLTRWVKVKFDDNNRVGKIEDLSDLKIIVTE